MNNPKRNHYVPEKLSGAWRHASRHIFQLDKDAASPIPKSVSINDAGVKRLLYSPEIEDYLGRYVESPAWPVLDRLRRREAVYFEDMEPLLIYMTSQIGRTLPILKGLEERKVAMESRIFETWAREGEGIIRDEDDDEIAESAYREAKQRAIIGRSPGILYVMRGMTWKVFVLPSPGELITSDHPVIRIGDKLSDPDAAIFFPISPISVLIGMKGINAKYTLENGIWVPGQMVRYETVDDSYGERANVEIARQASRFLYGQSEKALISAI